MDPARAFTVTYPTYQISNHKGHPDHWVAPDAPDAYTPMADGLSLISNGYGFYEAHSAPQRNLCKPQTAAVHDKNNIEFQFQPQLEIICCCDQPHITRFSSPGESSTPPGTPASMAASAPSPSTSTSTSDMDRCPSPSWATAISTEDARQLMETYVRHATWFQMNAMEPCVGDDGVPTFARLLTRPGESVYRCFVDTRKDRKGKPVYYCTGCGFKSDRLHRLIGHQRSKRGHRPFACPDNGCDFRGYSAESLGDHKSDRNGLQTCKWCDDTIVKKNMARHVQVMHAHVY